MKENVINIKNGVKLHLIKTDLFKTDLSVIFITIPLDRSTINFDTESIDLDFENIELEEFSLYVMANSALKSAKTTRTVCLTIAGALLVIVIIVIVKSSKKSSASDTSGVSGSVGSSSASSATCKYCGTVHEPGTKKCSNCGAQLR